MSKPYTTQKARFQDSVFTEGLESARCFRCAPTSWTKRVATLIRIQTISRVVVLDMNTQYTWQLNSVTTEPGPGAKAHTAYISISCIVGGSMYDCFNGWICRIHFHPIDCSKGMLSSRLRGSFEKRAPSAQTAKTSAPKCRSLWCKPSARDLRKEGRNTKHKTELKCVK